MLIHRRVAFEVTRHRDIPVTTPVCTLVDLATMLSRGQLERAINQADNLDLTDTESLRSALDGIDRRPGLKTLRETLDIRTFVLTDSELERLFVPIALGAGFSKPWTGQYVNGFKVDFYWPDLGLVVEADSLRYHRTPAEQARDRLRDQAHAAAGLTSVRFTHEQIAHQPAHVGATLAAVARRLRSEP